VIIVSPQQDKAQPETQARVFGDVRFNAALAADDPSAMALVRQPGSDGFRLDSTAMFQVVIVVEMNVPLPCEKSKVVNRELNGTGVSESSSKTVRNDCWSSVHDLHPLHTITEAP